MELLVTDEVGSPSFGQPNGGWLCENARAPRAALHVYRLYCGGWLAPLLVFVTRRSLCSLFCLFTIAYINPRTVADYVLAQAVLDGHFPNSSRS